jgi:Flp pilus assembly protein TadG
MTLVYVAVMLTVLVLFASFAVDLGRVQLAKTQLQNAADAAGRYAVSGLVSSSTPETTAQKQALACLSDWNIEGSAFDPTNVTTTVGDWDTTAKTFTPDSVSPNSVKIDLVYTFAPGNGKVPLFLQAVSSSQRPTIHASAIVMATSQQNTFSPPAAGNIWLAGMPAGTLNQDFRPDNSTLWDYAGTTATPKQSPLELDLGTFNATPGATMAFEGLSGTASYVSSAADNDADGDENFLVSLGQTYPTAVPNNSMNGIANVRAPIGAIMAVFLDDKGPNSGSTPSGLDFGTQAQRDYDTISPKLKQPFFVGDGKKSNGEVQHIVVPAGATRVFIGMMDAWQWNDNKGNFKFKVYGHNVISMVK